MKSEGNDLDVCRLGKRFLMPSHLILASGTILYIFTIELLELIGKISP